MSLLGDIIDRVLFPNRELHVIPVLDGAFSPNQRLDQARQLGDEIERPDDIVLGQDGALYVSTGNRILRCTGDDFNKRTVFAALDGPVGGLACTPGGRLLACVSGVGLVALSPAGEITGKLESVGGEKIACPLSVTVAPDGAIYLTDGSRNNRPDLWLADLMQDRAPSGRLIACNPSLGNASVRADKLAWPLGVAVSPDGGEVWVAESWAHRLSAFSRAGGDKRVIVKNYTGYPARLGCGPDGEVWMAFLALRTQLTEFVLRERAFCDEMMRTVPPELWIGPVLDGRLNPREPTQIGRIKKLGIQKPWAPPRSYGLVARLDTRGLAVETLHSRVDGRVHGITTVRPIGSRVLAVSKGRDRLVELPAGRSAEEG
ncbi:sugar lactone lactonase YvrE [Bradyrhizobium embrapense]